MIEGHDGEVDVEVADLWEEYVFCHDVKPGCSTDDYLATPAQTVAWLTKIHHARVDADNERQAKANRPRR